MNDLKKVIYSLAASARLEDRIGAVCIFSLKFLPLTQRANDSQSDDSDPLPQHAQEMLQYLVDMFSPYFLLEILQTSQMPEVQEAGCIALMLALQYRFAPCSVVHSMRSDMIQCFLCNSNVDLVEKWQLLLRLCWVASRSESTENSPNDTIMTEAILSCLAKKEPYPPSSSILSSSPIQVNLPHSVLNSIVDDVMQSAAENFTRASKSSVTLTEKAASGLRSLCVQCLHGAASERYRDDTIRALTILLDTRFLDPKWTLSTTDENNFPVVLTSIIAGEIRLITEEIACFVPVLAPWPATAEQIDQRTKEEARLSRDLHVLSQCMTLLQLTYTNLLGADTDASEDGEDGVVLPVWQQCTGENLLRLKVLLQEAQTCLLDLLCQLAAPTALPMFIHNRLPLLLHIAHLNGDVTVDEDEEYDTSDRMENEMRLILTLMAGVKSVVRDGLNRFILEDEAARQRLLEEHTISAGGTEGEMQNETPHQQKFHSGWEALMTLSSLWILPVNCPVDDYGGFTSSIVPRSVSASARDAAGRTKLTVEEKFEIREVFAGLRHLWLREDSSYDTLYMMTAVIQDLQEQHDAEENNLGPSSKRTRDDDDDDDDDDEVGASATDRQIAWLEALRDTNAQTIQSDIPKRLGHQSLRVAEKVLAPLIHMLVRYIPLFVDFLQLDEEEATEHEHDGEWEEDQETQRVIFNGVFLLLRSLRLLLQATSPLLTRLARVQDRDVHSDVAAEDRVSGVTTAFATLFDWSLPTTRPPHHVQDSHNSHDRRGGEWSLTTNSDARFLVEEALPRCLISIVAVVRQQLQQNHGQQHPHQYLQQQQKKGASDSVERILQEVQLVQGMLMKIERVAMRRDPSPQTN